MTRWLSPALAGLFAVLVWTGPVAATHLIGGTHQADKSTFTEGTTNANPAACVRNDTRAGDIGEDQAGAVRCTPKGDLQTNPRAAADGQDLSDDRPSGTVALDTLNEIAKVRLSPYQTVSVTFSSSTLTGATVKPVCSFTGNADADFKESGDFKFSDTTDEDAIAASLTTDFNRTYTISCGATSPTWVGVKLTALGSGSANVDVRAHAVRAWWHIWPEWVDKTLKAIVVKIANVVQIGAQSGASSVDSFTNCTGQFNEVLDANELVHLTTLPAAGQLARICEILAVIDAGATGSANFAIWEGTTTTTPCDTSAQVVLGPWTFEKASVPGIKLGKLNSTYKAITAARRFCGKSTNATATNKIILVGTYATY